MPDVLTHTNRVSQAAPSSGSPHSSQEMGPAQAMCVERRESGHLGWQGVEETKKIG